MPMNIDRDGTGVSLTFGIWRASAYRDALSHWRIGPCGLAVEGEFRSWGLQLGSVFLEVSRTYADTATGLPVGSVTL